MENAGRFVEDKHMASTLKKTGGIGTPATRASILERLIKVGYIKREKKNLVPIPKGETLIGLVPESLKSPETTAKWEQGLLEIEEGKALPNSWLEGIKQLTREAVQVVREQESSVVILEAIGKCPLCGKDVIEGKKGYGCSGWKEGCKFVIWREIAGKTLSVNQVKDLIVNGRTDSLDGFKSKLDKPFTAALSLKEDGSVEFDFAREVLGICPLCGQNVVETPKGYGCSGWKNGCMFTIWKQMAGKEIAIDQVRDLLKNGNSAVIEGFKSKTGKSFEAKLRIKDGLVEFCF
jgi:DNA topoisomerase-3